MLKGRREGGSLRLVAKLVAYAPDQAARSLVGR